MAQLKDINCIGDALIQDDAQVHGKVNSVKEFKEI